MNIREFIDACPRFWVRQIVGKDPFFALPFSQFCMGLRYYRLLAINRFLKLRIRFKMLRVFINQKRIASLQRRLAAFEPDIFRDQTHQQGADDRQEEGGQSDVGVLGCVHVDGVCFCSPNVQGNPPRE